MVGIVYRTSVYSGISFDSYLEVNISVSKPELYQNLDGLNIMGLFH